jgi:hypothetical protein
VHVIAVPAHTPAVQTSAWVQEYWSSQARPDTAVQTPSELAPAATLHARQSLAVLPPHAVLQQTPSTQKPLRQVQPFVQTVPFGSAGPKVKTRALPAYMPAGVVS